jgi:SET domain-containing protein
MKTPVAELISDSSEKPPAFLEVRDAGDAGQGIFAVSAIDRDTIIGSYTGTVYPVVESIDIEGDYLLTVTVGDTEYIVDAQETWPGKFNHKWRWPFNRALDTDLQSVFANTEVMADGTIFSLRDIEADEEVTWDYGVSYWEDKGQPTWDWSSLSREAIEKLANLTYYSDDLAVCRDTSIIKLPPGMTMPQKKVEPTILAPKRKTKR